jgi:DNA-binding NarL/FixJ family response regulator
MKILVAEDHPLYRDGLRSIIESDPKLTLVFETGDGIEAMDAARRLSPDLAVLDINLPGMGGLEIARTRLKENLSFEIVFITMYREQALFDEALDLQVNGYVLKDSTPEEIHQAILSVGNGQIWYSPSLGEFMIDHKNRQRRGHKEIPGLESLTPTERRVLKLVASDRTTKEIAAQFGVSHRTIDSHRAHIGAKLGLSGSHSLLKFAFDNRDKL